MIRSNLLNIRSEISRRSLSYLDDQITKKYEQNKPETYNKHFTFL